MKKSLLLHEGTLRAADVESPKTQLKDAFAGFGPPLTEQGQMIMQRSLVFALSKISGSLAGKKSVGGKKAWKTPWVTSKNKLRVYIEQYF